MKDERLPEGWSITLDNRSEERSYDVHDGGGVYVVGADTYELAITKALERAPKPRAEIDAEKAAKPRPDLVPGAALTAMGEVMAYGYGKHGRCTWRNAGTEQAKPETHIASAFRHLAQMGADYDERDDESGLPHLHHALSQLAIAVECVGVAPAVSPERRAELRSQNVASWLPAAPSYTVLPEAGSWVLRTRGALALDVTEYPTKAEAMAAGEAWLAAQKPAARTLNATVPSSCTVAVDGGGGHAVVSGGQWYPVHLEGERPQEPRREWYGAKIVAEPPLELIRSLLPEGWRIERDECYAADDDWGWDLYEPGAELAEWAHHPAWLLAAALHKAWIEAGR